MLFRSKEACLFDGWYKDPECTNAWDFETDMVTSDIILYAKWTQETETVPAQSVSDVLKASEEKIDLAAANVTISKIKPKMYDGMSYTPVVKVTVKDGKKQVTLTEGVDYSVKYTNNVNAGTGQVIIQGGGNYTGSVTQEFTINKKPISKLKIVADGMTVNSKAAPSIWIYDGSRMVAKRDYKQIGRAHV